MRSPGRPRLFDGQRRVEGLDERALRGAAAGEHQRLGQVGPLVAHPGLEPPGKRRADPAVEDVRVAALARALGQDSDPADGLAQTSELGGDGLGVPLLGGHFHADDPGRLLSAAGLDGDRDGEEPGLVRAAVDAHEVHEVLDLDGARGIQPPPVVHGQARVGEDRGTPQPPRQRDERPGERGRQARRRRLRLVDVGPGEEGKQQHAPLDLGTIGQRRGVKFRQRGEIAPHPADQIAGRDVLCHLLPRLETRRQAPKRLVGR